MGVHVHEREVDACGDVLLALGGIIGVQGDAAHVGDDVRAEDLGRAVLDAGHRDHGPEPQVGVVHRVDLDAQGGFDVAGHDHQRHLVGVDDGVLERIGDEALVLLVGGIHLAEVLRAELQGGDDLVGVDAPGIHVQVRFQHAVAEERPVDARHVAGGEHIGTARHDAERVEVDRVVVESGAEHRQARAQRHPWRGEEAFAGDDAAGRGPFAQELRHALVERDGEVAVREIMMRARRAASTVATTCSPSTMRPVVTFT